jgi:hypothetical protein
MYRPTGRPMRRRGTSMVLTCASMTGILYLTAMAIDCGNMQAARRQAQNCCDAAAITGCLYVSRTLTNSGTPTASNVSTAAKLSATNNNYVDGTNCTVTVNWPPTSGNYQNTNSVEVKITFTYANLVVGGSNSVTVRSVASCQTSTAPTQPMLITDPSGSKSFYVTSGKLSMATAPIQVNSTSTTSAVVDGATGSAADATVDAVGGSSGTFSPAVKGGGSPVADPLATLPTPSTSGLTTYTQSTYTPTGGTVTLNPGYYPNGLYVSSGNVVMNPGLYYIENGNFWINTPGTVTGNGVTIYHNGTNSTAQLQSSYGLNVGICLCPQDGSYTFTPPSTGAYAGISFFQSRSYSGEAFYDFWGTGNLNVGLQYFPDGTLRAWSANNGGAINCNQLITKDFKLTGIHEIYGSTQNGGFSNLTWNSTRSTTMPPSTVYLAE